MQTENKEEKLFTIEQVAVICCWVFEGDYIHTLTNKNETNKEIRRQVKHYSDFPQLDGAEPPPPVEQTVDAGQLEKIIDDAFQAGQKREYHEFKRAYNDVYKWEEAEEHIPTKSQYIEQAIEQFNNSKK